MIARVLLILLLYTCILSGCSSILDQKQIGRSIASSQSKDVCLEAVSATIKSQNIEKYHLLKNERARISKKYSSNSRFVDLSSDAAHNYQQTFKSKLEAVSGLYAEKQGVLQYPIIRGPPECEFIDGNNIMWDVKTPISPLPWQKWKFSAYSAGNSVRKKLLRNHGLKILLDISYLKPEHLADLRQWIQTNLPEELQSRVIEIFVPDGIEVISTPAQ